MTIFVAKNKPKQSMMDSNAKITNKIKLQISKFLGIISKGLTKPKIRLIKVLMF